MIFISLIRGIRSLIEMPPIPGFNISTAPGEKRRKDLLFGIGLIITDIAVC